MRPLIDDMRSASGPDRAAKAFAAYIDAYPHVEKFCFSLAASNAVDDLAKDVGKLWANRELLRAPYEACLVELERQPIASNGREPIDRIGALVTSTEIGRTITPYWHHVAPHASGAYFGVSIFTILMPFDHKLRPPANHYIAEISDPSVPDLKAYAVPAAWIMHHHKEMGLSPSDSAQLWEHLKNKTSIERRQQVVLEAAEEVPAVGVAWLALLISKSGLTRTPIQAVIPPSTYGKKKRLKALSSAYTKVTLTPVETVGANGSVRMRADFEPHWVRGHFKIRKTGIFWWSPFVRGDGVPKTRAAYLV